MTLWSTTTVQFTPGNTRLSLARGVDHAVTETACASGPKFEPCNWMGRPPIQNGRKKTESAQHARRQFIDYSPRVYPNLRPHALPAAGARVAPVPSTLLMIGGPYDTTSTLALLANPSTVTVTL